MECPPICKDSRTVQSRECEVQDGKGVCVNKDTSYCGDGYCAGHIAPMPEGGIEEYEAVNFFCVDGQCKENRESCGKRTGCKHAAGCDTKTFSLPEDPDNQITDSYCLNPRIKCHKTCCKNDEICITGCWGVEEKYNLACAKETKKDCEEVHPERCQLCYGSTS